MPATTRRGTSLHVPDPVGIRCRAASWKVKAVNSDGGQFFTHPAQAAGMIHAETVRDIFLKYDEKILAFFFGICYNHYAKIFGFIV